MNRRIWLLVVVHVVAGIAFSGWAAQEGSIPFVLSEILLVPPFALACCQSGLLAFWAAMSHGALWRRGVAVITGVVALEFLLGWALDQDEPTWIPAIATGLVTAVLSIIRLWRSELCSASRQWNQGNGLQFSIRGLMLLTLVVAVFMALGKHMRQLGVDGPTLPLRFTWASCFAVSNLAAVWAAMGLCSPWFRCGGALLLSLAIAATFCWCFAADWESWFYVTTILVLEIALSLGSLLVVRSCGYRLVPYPTNQRTEPQQDDSDKGVT
jgi:hypothetical protein